MELSGDRLARIDAVDRAAWVSRVKVGTRQHKLRGTSGREREQEGSRGERGRTVPPLVASTSERYHTVTRLMQTSGNLRPTARGSVR